MAENLRKYAGLYRKSGPWCAAYVDAGAGTVEGLEAAEVRPGNVRNAAAAQGAPPADLEAIETAVDPARGVPGPVSRFVLVRDGTVELNELLPGPLVTPKQIHVGPVPDLLPLFKHRPEEFPYIVADVSREGGEIRLEYVGRPGVASVGDVEGSTEDIHKLSTGIWGQDKLQRRTEEVWRRNADEVAAQIDRIADASGVKLIVLAGDVRARGLVLDQLAEAHKPLAGMLDSHTRTGGPHQDSFEDRVRELIALRWAAEQEQIMDRLALQQGQANPESAQGIGAVVHALQQAQVDVLILNDNALADRTLLALGAEPWVATAEEQALGAEVLGKVPASAALLRAAALTDASLLLVPNGVLPDGVGVAALLRWQTGPNAPGGNASLP
ncbi:Vms1/Ankzf1 family peptidyl-tRNA hydrolase [Arthrobacter sp. APC 3897]|uniref:baeRF2 domain-containing protein n=1 Tax=Arthrobacter sp. APC 3897 TaxID=3035204 RepID=UPI0025B572FF|nr:Vms1/Ankzf1 family peptidyl-tRNA hydrolase [Arthrobacter sp. APC 3897]MDN3481258.1 Vms1/Ankzf1 family peptidyl-tRNA hydrolase [Arthrobacter sp. APC 3897]